MNMSKSQIHELVQHKFKTLFELFFLHTETKGEVGNALIQEYLISGIFCCSKEMGLGISDSATKIINRTLRALLIFRQ